MAKLLAPYYTTQSLKSRILVSGGFFFLFLLPLSFPSFSFSHLFLILCAHDPSLLPRDFILSLLGSFSPSVKCIRVCCSPSHQNEKCVPLLIYVRLANASRARFRRWPTCLVSMIVGIMRGKGRMNVSSI